MAANRSLGGIGKLYSDDVLVGEVYYNIRVEPQRGFIVGSIVFVGVEIELPGDDSPYRLILEDGRSMILTIGRSSSAPLAAWSCVSRDGILHTEPSYSFS
jgi:hypothetical protein